MELMTQYKQWRCLIADYDAIWVQGTGQLLGWSSVQGAISVSTNGFLIDFGSLEICPIFKESRGHNQLTQNYSTVMSLLRWNIKIIVASYSIARNLGEFNEYFSTPHGDGVNEAKINRILCVRSSNSQNVFVNKI